MMKQRFLQACCCVFQFLIMVSIGTLAAKEQKFYILDGPPGDNDNGFFSCFHTATGFFDFYEKNKKNCAGIRINFTSGRYLDLNRGPNWWNYFFEPIEIGHEAGAKIVHISERQKHQFGIDAISKISREAAARLIAQYVRVRPHVQKKVDDFVMQHFKNNFVIGVHYRGTDHFIDASYVSYEETLYALVKLLKDYNPAQFKVFVASDEQPFVDFITHKQPNVICYDAHRSSNQAAIHDQMRHNYFIGEEALIDCLLLARCDVIVRTYSNLNSAAANINPKIPIITLNKCLPHLPTGLR